MEAEEKIAAENALLQKEIRQHYEKRQRDESEKRRKDEVNRMLDERKKQEYFH